MVKPPKMGKGWKVDFNQNLSPASSAKGKRVAHLKVLIKFFSFALG